MYETIEATDSFVEHIVITAPTESVSVTSSTQPDIVVHSKDDELVTINRLIIERVIE